MKLKENIFDFRREKPDQQRGGHQGPREGQSRALSLNFGIWIRDDGWPPGCGTPNNDNDEIQSSSVARESSSEIRIRKRIRRKECSKNKDGFVTDCFYKR